MGRIVKWSVELGEFDLEFCPRQAIKSQILADFVFEEDGDPAASTDGEAESLEDVL
jgi:hypothetical protein